jgi:thiol reductant ABC exporter CydC subunit
MTIAPAPTRREARRFLVSCLRPQRRRFLAAALLGAAASGSSVALTATAAWLISRAAQHPPVLYLMVAAVAVRTFGISRGVFRYLERLVCHDAALRVLSGLRTTMFAAMIPLVPRGLDDVRDADLMNRLVDDVDTVQDTAIRAVVPVVAASIVGIAVVAATALLLPAAAVTLGLALLLGGVGVPLVVGVASRRATARTAALRAELACHVVDLIDGAADLLVYEADEPLLARLASSDAELASAGRRQAASLAAGVAVTVLAAGGALWSAFVVGIPAVRAGTLSGVLLAVVALGSWAALDIAADLPGVALSFRRGEAAAARLQAITARAVPVAEPLDDTVPVAAVPGRRPEVVLRGVTVRRSPDRPVILDHVDLDLVAGRRVVVTGVSGAGKSTLIDTLLRFVELQSGSYTIDGVDVRALRSADVRAIVGCSEQQPHLFDSTLRENLLIGKPGASSAELAEVLDRVGLGGWLASLPAGLDTRVGAGGAEVSGGQARRIALARALLADFPVLLLDEPTEGLDDAAALELLTDTLLATRDRAVLLVTHRLLGIEAADVLLELVDGELRPTETYAALRRDSRQEALGQFTTMVRFGACRRASR